MLLATTLIILAVFALIFLTIASLDFLRSKNFENFLEKRRIKKEQKLQLKVIEEGCKKNKFKTFINKITNKLTGKKNNVRYNKKLCASAYLMLLPAVILAFFFVMLPIMFSLGYAFTDYYLLRPDDTKFVFLDNFKSIFQEIKYKGDLYHAIRNTTIFVVCVVPLQIGLALGLALFCNRKVPGVGIFKVCFFAPVVISLTVTSYLWLQILSPSESGLLNTILAIFGRKEPIDFLDNPKTTMLWIVLLSAWQG